MPSVQRAKGAGKNPAKEIEPKQEDEDATTQDGGPSSVSKASRKKSTTKTRDEPKSRKRSVAKAKVEEDAEGDETVEQINEARPTARPTQERATPPDTEGKGVRRSKRARN